MGRYIAFLRGMNLGARRIKNEELRRHFEQIGFEQVATFRASGNVVFSSSGREPESELARRLEAELGARLGYDVPVFLRNIAEVAAIAAQEPFDAKRVAKSKENCRSHCLWRSPARL
ncbi:MAG: DUF1697 domain-containing protein [Solirubrobacterales bacterium]